MRKPGIVTAVCSVLALGMSTFAPNEMVSVGDHHLQINVEGHGSPTVVIDTGIAETFDRWQALQERIAVVTSVVTYNRAGYGESEPGPLPRDSAREAAELKAMLGAAAVTGPYILVGHSLGALNVQIFAASYPDEVGGIVLLDPPPLSFIRGEEYTGLSALAERMTGEWQSIADNGSKSSDPEERRKAGFFRMIASEHRELFGKSGSLVSEISSFGKTPLVVMAAGKSNPAFGDIAEEYQRYWINQSRSLSHKSSHAKFVLAENSTHHLHLDVPDLVLENVLSMVYQVRREM